MCPETMLLRTLHGGGSGDRMPSYSGRTCPPGLAGYPSLTSYPREHSGRAPRGVSDETGRPHARPWSSLERGDTGHHELGGLLSFMLITRRDLPGDRGARAEWMGHRGPGPRRDDRPPGRGNHHPTDQRGEGSESRQAERHSLPSRLRREPPQASREKPGAHSQYDIRRKGVRMARVDSLRNQSVGERPPL